jgi:hypothetical protein
MDRVWYISALWHKITGTIIRLNRKSVTLITDHDRTEWKVAPSLLHFI